MVQLGPDEAVFLFHDNCNILRRHGYEPLEAPSEMLNLCVRGAMRVKVDLAKLFTDTNPRIPAAQFDAKTFMITVAERRVLKDWMLRDFYVCV